MGKKQKKHEKEYLQDISVFTSGHYRWWEIIKKIKYFFNTLKCARMRAKYGFCYRDTWNLDYYLATVIENSVRYLKHNHYGYPGTLNLEQDFSVEGNDCADEKWKNILEEIAEAFHESMEENYTDDHYDDYFKLRYEDGLAEDDPKVVEAREKWRKSIKEEEEYLEAQKERAFNLLKEWFFCLWD